MKMNLSRRSFRRPDARRGMTLVEILIAMGVLSVGMISICALLPLGIRNTAVATGRTVGASVAKTASVSLEGDAVDLSQLSADTAEVLGDSGTLALDGDSGDLQLAIKSYNDRADRTISAQRGFQIPGDLENATTFGDGNVVNYKQWDSGASQWVETAYGWSATLIPQGTISLQTTYTAQIAVWRNCKLIDSAAVGANFHVDNPQVAIVTAPEAWWGAVAAGDYVREINHGVWYKIAAVSKPDGKLILATDFPHDAVGTQLEVASRFRLLALYGSVVAPE